MKLRARPIAARRADRTGTARTCSPGAESDPRARTCTSRGSTSARGAQPCRTRATPACPDSRRPSAPTSPTRLSAMIAWTAGVSLNCSASEGGLRRATTCSLRRAWLSLYSTNTTKDGLFRSPADDLNACRSAAGVAARRRTLPWSAAARSNNVVHRRSLSTGVAALGWMTTAAAPLVSCARSTTRNMWASVVCPSTLSTNACCMSEAAAAASDSNARSCVASTPATVERDLREADDLLQFRNSARGAVRRNRA